MSTANGGTSGYLADLLHTMGVSVSQANHVQDLTLRPISVLAVAIVSVLAAKLGAQIVSRALNTVRSRSGRHYGLQASRVDTVSRIVANSWRVAVYVVGAITILQVVGVNLTPFLAGATVIGATIGFGAQSLVRDFLSGFLMLLEDQYRIGDVIAVNDVAGTVEEVSLRVTELRSDDGTIWYIPNGQILKLGNVSRHSTRTVISTSIAIGVPVASARQVLEEQVRAVTEQTAFADSVLRAPRVLGVSEVTAGSYSLDVELETKPAAADAIHRAVREALIESLARSEMLPKSPDA